MNSWRRSRTGKSNSCIKPPGIQIKNQARCLEASSNKVFRRYLFSKQSVIGSIFLGREVLEMKGANLALNEEDFKLSNDFGAETPNSH